MTIIKHFQVLYLLWDSTYGEGGGKIRKVPCLISSRIIAATLILMQQANEAHSLLNQNCISNQL